MINKEGYKHVMKMDGSRSGRSILTGRIDSSVADNVNTLYTCACHAPMSSPFGAVVAYTDVPKHTESPPVAAGVQATMTPCLWRLEQRRRVK